MNLTRIIEKSGQRLRMGKPPSERLTNAQVKQVLETAIQVMQEALRDEGRIEIQGFAVIEVKRTSIKPTKLNGKMTRGERTRWVIRVSDRLNSKLDSETSPEQ
jgi:nucleoid DNA-binding protein